MWVILIGVPFSSVLGFWFKTGGGNTCVLLKWIIFHLFIGQNVGISGLVRCSGADDSMLMLVLADGAQK